MVSLVQCTPWLVERSRPRAGKDEVKGAAARTAPEEKAPLQTTTLRCTSVCMRMMSNRVRNNFKNHQTQGERLMKVNEGSFQGASRVLLPLTCNLLNTEIITAFSIPTL